MAPSAAILAALLEWRRSAPARRGVRAIHRIALWSEEDVPGTGWVTGDAFPPQLLGTEEGAASAEGEETANESGDLSAASWQLAACLLLVRWGEPGARDLLSRRLREIGDDWRDSRMWKRFAPAEAAP